MFDRNYQASLYEGRINTARDDYDYIVLLAKKKNQIRKYPQQAFTQRSKAPQMASVRGLLSSSAIYNVIHHRKVQPGSVHSLLAFHVGCTVHIQC